MASINLQTSEHSSRFVPETALVPAQCQALAGGSSNPPKFGTLIPNRIFVGGIPSNTTEQELKSFFSSFGQVKDVKIINDRLGVSKGSYGFVTFESQELAEKIIKNESETLIFKDRKLNIGHAIRKQQMFPRTDLPAALFFAGGTMPYGFQNGMAVFPLPGQEYPMITQPTAPYATMMLPQPGGGTTLYLPTSLHSANSAAAASPYAQLSQHHTAATVNPNVSGAVTPVSAGNNGAAGANAQPTSTAAMMAAAAAAMAAVVQWPPQTASQAAAVAGHQQSQQLAAAAAHAAHATGQQTVSANTGLSAQQQAAAMAAAVAAQHATAWRWSPGSATQATIQQHQAQQPQAVAPVPVAVTAQHAGVTSTHSVSVATPSTPSLSNQAQQNSAAALGPATYLYSPIAGAGHELMFFHQTSSPYAANSTSDYSTDHSAHSSSMLESVEPMSFQFDTSPAGRHSQLVGPGSGAYAGQHLDAACLSPYAAFAPLLELQSQTNLSGPQAAGIPAPSLQQQLRHHLHHQSAATVMPGGPQHMIPVAATPSSMLSQSQHGKLYPTVTQTSVAQASSMIGTCQLPTFYGSTPVKGGGHGEISSANEIQVPMLSQGQNSQLIGVTGAPTSAAANTSNLGSGSQQSKPQSSLGTSSPVAGACSGSVTGGQAGDSVNSTIGGGHH